MTPIDESLLKWQHQVADVIAKLETRLAESQAENKRLTAEVERLREALNWLTHIFYNIGKSGGLPEPGEFEAAVDAAKKALKKGTEDDK